MFTWKIILFPFAFLFGLVTFVRNKCFDFGLLKSHKISGKSIVVGNLSVGGTGKSPHVLYLANLLASDSTSECPSILSRGYGRKTKGLLEVSEMESALNVGDEPLMFKKRMGSQAQVVVCEKRVDGVEYIRRTQPKSTIILDDAFQHRHVKAGFNILLTDFNRPYYDDFMLPMGFLREWRIGRFRSDCVVVTKCPSYLAERDKRHIRRRLKLGNKHIFFSSVQYADMISFGRTQERYSKILLVTGIANPKPLENQLSQYGDTAILKFKDHHNFTREDIDAIHAKFDTFAHEDSIIVTTEKDFVRLDSLLTADERQKYPWYFQSISIKIDEEEKFNALIKVYVDSI